MVVILPGDLTAIVPNPVEVEYKPGLELAPIQREILKFHRQPSWIFFQRVLGQNFKFLLSLCMGKLDLGMMFDDVFE